MISFVVKKQYRLAVLFFFVFFVFFVLFLLDYDVSNSKRQKGQLVKYTRL